MYKLFKTATKTAKHNNLIKSNNKTLFDFSIFDDCKMIPEEKIFIINECIKNCNSSIYDFDYIIYNFAEYENSQIKIYFKIYSIEDDYKKLYNIYKAVKIEYIHKIIDPWYNIEKTINQYEKMIDDNYKKEYLILNAEG